MITQLVAFHLHVLLQIHSHGLLFKCCKLTPVNCVKAVPSALYRKWFPFSFACHETFNMTAAAGVYNFCGMQCFSLSLFMWFKAVKEAKQQGPDRRLDMTMKLKAWTNCSPCWQGTGSSENTARQPEETVLSRTPSLRLSAGVFLSSNYVNMVSPKHYKESLIWG